MKWASQAALVGKEPGCQCRRRKRRGFGPWVGKIPWRRAWQSTPVFLLGESLGQRSLVGYSPWCGKDSDMTESDLACMHNHAKSTLHLRILFWCCIHSMGLKKCVMTYIHHYSIFTALKILCTPLVHLSPTPSATC